MKAAAAFIVCFTAALAVIAGCSVKSIVHLSTVQNKDEETCIVVPLDDADDLKVPAGVYCPVAP